MEFVLLDLDDTILDFKKAEHIAIAKTLGNFGLEPTDQVIARYSAINKAHWEMLERKEITREQVLSGRFETLFREYGKTVDAKACTRAYEENLSIGHYFLPGVAETLPLLAQKYKLYIVSNGTMRVQQGRLKSANILRYFQGHFVSEQMGAAKPDPVFFQNCFAAIPGFDPSRTIIAGDSLTSDILGGIRAGIATCWVNTRNYAPREDIRPDYEIQSLSQLPGLLEAL